jgi:PAS domain S-box-containing protein
MAGQDFGSEGAPSPYEDTLARRWERRRLILTVLATLAGIALALLLGRALRLREQDYAKAQFKASVARWSDSLRRSVTNRVEMVNTIVAFIRGTDLNDRKDFRRFVRQILKGQPSAEMLAWAPRIPAALRDAHEEAIRKQGYPKYIIRQRGDRKQFVAAGKREDYYPILFAEPATANNESLLGLDLGSGAVGRAAMRQAKATGRENLAVYTVLPGDKTGDNLLLVWAAARYESTVTHLKKRPDDQPEADGFVLGAFRMETLAKKWLSLPGHNIPSDIDVYIAMNGKDLTALCTGAQPKPIRDATGASASPPTKTPAGGVLGSEEFQVSNATFTVVYAASSRYIDDWGTWKPLSAVLTGLLITGLAVGYFRLLTGQMANVERRVADRWLELREREHYIRYLVDYTSDAIFLCDQQGKILDINQRSCDNLGYSRKELLSMTVADVEVPVVPENQELPEERSAEENPRTFESVYRRKDGTTFSVEVHSTLMGSGAQSLILTIVRDMTDRAQVEGLLSNNERPLAGMAEQLSAALGNFQTVERLLVSDPETARQSLNEGVRLLRKAMDTGR